MNEPVPGTSGAGGTTPSSGGLRTKISLKSGTVVPPFHTFKVALPPHSEIQGNHNLLTAYGLGPVEGVGLGKRVKEQISTFLPHLIGELHFDATKDASSLRALLEKPPIHKEITNLQSSAMQGFKLAAGPVDDRYKHLFERRKETGPTLQYSEKLNALRVRAPYDPYGFDEDETEKQFPKKHKKKKKEKKRKKDKEAGDVEKKRKREEERKWSAMEFSRKAERKKKMGSRKFGEKVPELDGRPEDVVDTSELATWMRTDEIGTDAVMEGPFGPRKVVYCDYTASARSFTSIENYIKSEVLPFYGNTHSSVTVTAEQTTLFMHEARQEIRAMTGCGDQDSVIFTGSGSTCAMELLMHLMTSDDKEDEVEWNIIQSCQEHHSNMLPWRGKGNRVYGVGELENGLIDMEELEKTLISIRNAQGESAKIIGTFTACSNLTGIVQNVQEVTRILKKYGAFAIWDFASAAPYIDVQVNGSDPLDAVFFSGHKFPGGVGSPGVLIVKKGLIKAKKPKRIGGGTVFFVTESDEWYLKEVEHREEGGTADAVGAIRLAMAVKMKRSVGLETIYSLESTITWNVMEKLQNIENLVLLGPLKRENRLPVFSFLVKNPESGMFFHHNYISVLLNDLFGIQTRAGCMCAGPYAQKLLGIQEEVAIQFVNALKESSQLDRTHLRRQAEYSQREFLRPGFTRISFPYFFSLQQVNDIVSALKFVSEHAADFLHLYQVNCETGEWHHQNQRVFHGRRWLGHVQFTGNGLKMKEIPKPAVENMKNCLKNAENLAKESSEGMILSKIPDGRVAVEKEFHELRWFVLPIEIAELRSGRSVNFQECVIKPRKYSELSEISNRIPPSSSTDKFEEEKAEEEICDDVICLLKCDENNQKQPIDEKLGEDVTEAEEVKELDDWNKRVIVTPVEISKEETARLEWHVPPLEMYKKVTEVIHQLKMIRNGDKVLVCLSGGKDSLSLLHILKYYQQRCEKARSTSFQLGAITVDPGSAEFNPRPLIEYCRSLNIDYFYEEQDIIGAAKKTSGLRSICAFCSRMKRGRLAAAAQLHGWNVLAMGQHLDDLAESFFIAAFQNGNLSTMKAQYTTKDGALRVIRPLVMVREKALRNFAEEKKLPIVAENCPACFNQATERHRIKQLLAQQELIFPDLFNSLRSALKPLLLIDSAHTSEMRSQAVVNILKSS